MPGPPRFYYAEAPENPYTLESALGIDKIIEPQFKDSVFYDPKFFKNFLPFVYSPDHVVGLCLGYDRYLRTHHEWEYPNVVDGEQCLYQPILYLLNTIKLATDTVLSSRPVPHEHNVHDLADMNAPTYKRYDPSFKPGAQGSTLTDGDVEYFADWSFRDLAHALPEATMRHLRPNIILFRGKRRHWSNIRFIVEIKEHFQYLPAGIKRLARYAHAVFAHQPSRRHFYSLLICGRKALFVRFDHAGILYSRPLEVTRSPTFAIALASLLSLDEVDQGLDPAFKSMADGDYIDLPEFMLGKDSRMLLRGGPSARDPSNLMKTRRFRILQQSGHPASRCRVNGPGTFVFRIREHTTTASSSSPAEYTLKLSWRLDNNRSEGRALEEAEGIFGVPQHVSHGDIVMPGKSKCALPLGVPGSPAQCTVCVDRTKIVDELQVLDNFRDLSVNIPLESGDGVPQERVDLGEFLLAPKSARANRIYSYVLSSSFGKLMEEAESPKIYVNAMVDAILGYWGLYNMGIVQCEITPFNLLVLTKEQKFRRQRWEEPHEIVDPVLAESEEQLRVVLKKLEGTSPVGMLIDLSAHQRLGPRDPPPIPAPIKDKPKRVKRRKGDPDGSVATKPSTVKKKLARRGPPGEDGPQCPLGYVSKRNGIFSSTRVARALLTPDQPYRHHYYDDLESFFWVMLWTAISHIDPGKKLNEHAINFRTEFHSTDTGSSHIDWKESTLEDCAMSGGQVTKARLNACDNQWASDRLLQHVIITFGAVIGCFRRREKVEERISPPGMAFTTVIGFILGEIKTIARDAKKS